MQIISWNVASVRARLPLIISLLKNKNPDIVFLQEIKATDDVFPFQAFKEAGYYAYINGQKGFNGVAVLSKEPFEQINRGFLNGYTDVNARYIAVQKEKTVFICVYAPNGAPPASDITDTSRLVYKLEWYQALKETLLLYQQEGFQIVLGGDFNVIEEDKDVYNPAEFKESPLMIPPVRKAFKNITDLSFINTLKHFSQPQPFYTYWDFQMGAFRKNWGILLDYIFLSDALGKNLKFSGVLKEYRAAEKPSDHAPVYCVLE